MQRDWGGQRHYEGQIEIDGDVGGIGVCDVQFPENQ